LVLPEIATEPATTIKKSDMADQRNKTRTCTTAGTSKAIRGSRWQQLKKRCRYNWYELVLSPNNKQAAFIMKFLYNNHNSAQQYGSEECTEIKIK
jgi:hypothetical protein